MISAYQHGIYPRSEAVVSATRDLDRGRTTREAVDQQYDSDLTDFIDAQKQAGLDYLSDGLLRWQDLFRPLVESSEGLKVGPLVRWFDNNAFLRTPEAVGSPALNGSLPAVFDTRSRLSEPRMATLPSPLLFSRVAATHGDRNQLMLDIADKLLRPLAGKLVSEGYSLIQLQEPWLAYHGIDKADVKPFSESIRLITEGLGATTVLHTYFGDAAPWAELLRELPVSAVGVDFVETNVEALGSNWKVGIVAGCLNGRNSLVESTGAIVEFVNRLADALDPPDIYLSSNSDLEFLPQTVARQKVLRLGEAAQRLKGQKR